MSDNRTITDRATVAAIAVLQIITDAEQELDLDPRELQLRLWRYLADEYDDIARQVAAERKGYDDA